MGQPWLREHAAIILESHQEAGQSHRDHHYRMQPEREQLVLRAGACDCLTGLAVPEGLAEWLASAATGGAVAQTSAGTWIGSYVLRQSGIYW